MYDEELAQQPGVFVSADQISSLAVVAVSGLIAEVGSPHISPYLTHISPYLELQRCAATAQISPYLPIPASWAGSPRTRAAPRPEQTADGWPARVSRGWVRLGLGFPVEEVVSVRVRVSTRSVKLGLRAPRHGSKKGSKVV